MKKSSLTTAVVAGLAGAAGLVNVSNAVNVNPDGLGQVLIYPYYTVNNGNMTLISVVNTTNDVKAVKVRFLEGMNSQEVLDFNLYLSPFDVWTGAVHESGEGAALTSNDNSCTYGKVNDIGPVAFRNLQYAVLNVDGGPIGLDRTREGYVEMIEMGRVVNDSDVDAFYDAVDATPGDSGMALATAITHVQTGLPREGVPYDCSAIFDAFETGVWATNPEIDIDEPNGGLFGGGEIVNVSSGTNLSYNAEALEGFYQLTDADVGEFADLHSAGGSLQPSLNQAADLNGTGVAQAIVFDNGTLVTLDFDRGLDAVSAAIMHNQVFNEFVTNADLGASSEWVMTFPTKRFHIEGTITYEERRPFTRVFLGASDPSAPRAESDVVGACEPINVGFWDREELAPGTFVPIIPVCDISPCPPPPDPETAPPVSLCWEANVVSFNQEGGATDILGSLNTLNFPLVSEYDLDGTPSDDSVPFTEGWVRIDFYADQINNDTGVMVPFATPQEDSADGGIDADDVNDHSMLSLPELSGDVNLIEGLPVVGFWAANYINSDVSDGVLASYAGIHKHRSDRTGYGIADPAEETVPTGFSWS